MIHMFFILISMTLFFNSVLGQTQLTPNWVVTVPYGYGQNGVLSIDQSTDLIYWGQNTSTDYWYLDPPSLAVYDQIGNDVTPSPPWNLNLYPSYFTYSENLFSIEASNDTILIATMEQNSMPELHYYNSIVKWTVSDHDILMGSYGAWGGAGALQDEYGIIAAVSKTVVGFDNNGDLLWGGEQVVSALSANKLYGIVYPNIVVYNRFTGGPLYQFPLNTTAVPGMIWNPSKLIYHNDHLYYAIADQASNSVSIGKMDTLGTGLWNINVPLSLEPHIKEILVDDNGAVWVGVTLLNQQAPVLDGGRLISVDPTGSFSHYYTFGTNISDIEYDNDMIFACGWLDSASVDSYLFAAQPGVATQILDNASSLSELKIFPNPANETTWVQWSNDQFKASQLKIRDVFGRIQYQETVQGVSNINLDLRGYIKGIYTVELESMNGSVLASLLVVD